MGVRFLDEAPTTSSRIRFLDEDSESTSVASSSSAGTPDAGYDYSSKDTRAQPLEIPQSQDASPLPKPDPYKGEARSVTGSASMDWLMGVNNAFKANNPTLVGKLAETVYEKSMANSSASDEIKDVLDAEATMRKDRLLQDVTEAQEFVAEGLGFVADPVALASGTVGSGLKVMMAGKRVSDVTRSGMAAVRAASAGSKAAKTEAAASAVATAKKALEAQKLARIAKLATAGGAYAGTYETMDQLAQDGKITDPLAILAYTAGGATVPVVFNKVLSVGERVLDKSMLRSLEKKTKENIVQHGMNDRAAFNHALSDMNLDRGAVTEVLDGTGMSEVYANTIEKWNLGQKATAAGMKTDKYVDFTKVNNGILQRMKNRTVGAITHVAEGFDKAVEPISSGIRKISPEVFGAIRRFEYNTHKDTNAWRGQIAPAQKIYNKFSKEEKLVFTKAARNGDVEVAEHLFRQHGGADGVAAYKAVRPVLDDIYDQMVATGVDINYLTNHWPMYLKSGKYDQMVKDMGWDPKSTWDRAIKAKEIAKGEKADFNNEVARLEKKYNRELSREELAHVKSEVDLWEKRKISLTDKEQSDLLNSSLKGITPQGLRTPTAARSRVIEKVTDDQLKYIEDPFINLMSYIDHSAHTINTRKFFGKHIKDGDPSNGTDDSIGALVGDLKNNGDIRAQDEKRLTELLNSRFKYAHTGPMTARVKNIFYATKLGQADSAITQLADLGTAAYVNGLRNSLEGMWRYRNSKFPNILEEAQAKKVASEFETTRGTAQAIQDFAMTASGFRHIDQLGKTVQLRGALQKNIRAVSKAKSVQEFRKKWEPIFGEELDSLVGDLQKGRMSDNVKFMLFNELSDVQPISLLEVPQMYLESPNGRMFYAMKTFMMKQFDLVRREALSKIVSGNAKQKAEGVGNLLKYSMTVGVMNHSTEQAKNVLSGRDTNWTDPEITAVLKNFGISSFLVKKVMDEADRGKSPSTAVLSYILSNPYEAVGETAWRVGGDIWNLRGWDEMESMQDIPPAGKIIYNLYGGGVEKIMEQEQKKMREDYGYGDRDEYEDDK